MSNWQANGPLPRNGYRAEIHGHLITGSSPRIVIDKWARLLEGEGVMLTPGWDEEIWEALAKSHPKHIKRVPGKPKKIGVGLGSIMSFIKFTLRRVTDRTLVPADEARRRAAICTSCPQAVPVSGCSVCKAALQLTISPPEEVEAPAGCAACGCYLPLKVWVGRSQLGSADAFPYWEHCWMREGEIPEGVPGRKDG